MERITIADAIRRLENLLQVLDNAYWEVSEITHKDVVYDIISTINMEVNELAKLSIQDHYMAYEPITASFRCSQGKLKTLQNNIHLWIHRSGTALQLEQELPAALILLNNS